MIVRQTGAYEGRTVRIDSREFKLKSENFISKGVDGEVYRINQSEVVKVYIKPERATGLKNKISVLCGKSQSFADSVVAPIASAWLLEDDSSENFCGFSMRFVQGARNIDDFAWKPGMPKAEEQLLDRTVAGFLYDLCDGLRTLHQSRVVVADLKPDNILVAEGRAWLIDFDSCDIAPDYPADNWTEDYLDPLLCTGALSKGPTQGFNSLSDWWALGVIAFQLFLGLLPWEGANPHLFSTEERITCYSVIGFDPDVGVPQGFMRPMEWFNDKQRLLTYFENLFSPDIQGRRAIDFVLESYIPRPRELDRSTWQPSQNYPAVEANNFNRELLEAIRRRAVGHIHSLERNRGDFLNDLLKAAIKN